MEERRFLTVPIQWRGVAPRSYVQYHYDRLSAWMTADALDIGEKYS